MLDASLRRWIDPPLETVGAALAHRGVSADAVTLIGFVIGIIAIPLLALNLYGLSLVAILVNRLADGLDGAIARTTGGSDRGGYLDIVCDFVFYSAIPFGFALAEPTFARPAAFLIFSFVGTGASFLAFAIIAEKRGLTTDIRGKKAFYYLGGLTEGTETIAFFVFVCLVPSWFSPAAVVFGGMCWITTVVRGFAGWRMFADDYVG